MLRTKRDVPAAKTFTAKLSNIKPSRRLRSSSISVTNTLSRTEKLEEERVADRIFWRKLVARLDICGPSGQRRLVARQGYTFVELASDLPVELTTDHPWRKAFVS
jgi:hypothetical protein